MRKFDQARRPVHIFVLALVLLFSTTADTWSAPLEEGVCDVNADQALGLENYPVAITLHRQFLRTHRNDALGHYHLGFAYGMTGRTADEISEYLAATKLGLEKWDLYMNLGLAYLDQKNWSKAISTLQTAVLLGPAHPEAHFNLAIAYEGDGDLSKASQEINASLALAPADPDEHNTKAIICAERGDFVCARDEWALLVQVAPDYAPAKVNLTIMNGSQIPPANSWAYGVLNGNSFAFAR